jgi:hypothetical protein
MASPERSIYGFCYEVRKTAACRRPLQQAGLRQVRSDPASRRPEITKRTGRCKSFTISYQISSRGA